MGLLRRLSPLLLAASLLAGCAPAAIGTAPSSAYRVSSKDITTTPGGTLYVRAHFTFADFKIDPTTITGMLWVPTGYASEAATVTSTFDLNNVQVPQGWGLSLVQVKAVHSTVAAARTIDKSTDEYTLDVLFEIAAKPQAVSGSYHLRATLSYQKESKPIRVDVTVKR